jgi:hypothetical protein
MADAAAATRQTDKNPIAKGELQRQVFGFPAGWYILFERFP